MRILVISRGAWRDDSNEGSVFTNFFSSIDAEFANIFCSPGLPQNEVCKQYFQITDKMALDNILHKKEIGIRLDYLDKALNDKQPIENENKGFYDFFRKHNFEFFYTARELLWHFAKYKNKALEQFVKDFNPDIIFAPLCYSSFVLDVQRFAITASNAPAVTYIYDDVYSLKQFRFSPFFWINRLALRKSINKSMKQFSFAYTMTQQQKNEYKRYFDCEIKVLKKAANISNANTTSNCTDNIIRFIYAGGIYYGREKTLCRIAKAIKKANEFKNCARLDIYSSSPLSKKVQSILNDGVNSKINEVVSFDELKQIYSNSNVALHAEDFSLKNSLITRLSFSTKIVDCLSSGCAVLAVGPYNNAGIQYLGAENAALCITDKKAIDSLVLALISDKGRQEALKERARKCLIKNHQVEENDKQLMADFSRLMG